MCTVRTMNMQETMLRTCDERGDEWSEVVRESVRDLPVANAIYHQRCSTNFRKKMNIPVGFASDHLEKQQRKSGRPVDENLNEAFLLR